MEDLIKAAQALLTYIKWGGVYDALDDDGDGHTASSQSHELRELTENLEDTVNAIIPIADTVNLVKEGIIALVQIGIARQTKQPITNNPDQDQTVWPHWGA